MLEHFKGDEEFVSKILDYKDQALYSQRMILTQFLDPHQQSIVESVIGHELKVEADGGFDAGVEDRQARQIQRHCDCEGSPEFGHRAGAGQPHLEHADGHRAQRRQGARRGAGERRLLPV